MKVQVEFQGCPVQFTHTVCHPPTTEPLNKAWRLLREHSAQPGDSQGVSIPYVLLRERERVERPGKSTPGTVAAVCL